MKRSAFLCCLLVLAMALTGVSTIALAAQKTIVEYLHDPDNGENWRQWLKTAEAKFEAENPDIDIQMVFLPTRGEMLTKISVLYATGMLSDVVENGPSEGATFISQGMFQDLNPYMKKETGFSWNDIFPSLMPAITEDNGKRYYMPISIWLIGGAFNLDQFAESGLQAPTEMKQQWTWDDFRQMARKLVRDDASGTRTRYGAEVARDWNRWPVWVHNAGGFMFDRYFYPTASLLNTEPVRIALQFLQDIFQVDRSAYWDGRQAAFNAGKSSMSLNAGPSFTQDYRKAGLTFNYSIGPNPKNVRGGSEITTSALLLSSQSKHPEAAWRWIKYLATKGAYDHMAITGRPTAYRAAAVQYSKYLVNPSPWENAWINMIASPDTYHRPVYSKDIRDVLQSHANKIFEGKGAVETELAAAHAEITARFQQAK